jgi:hypothetical protein
MPLPYGTQLHTDTSHMGTAKRDARDGLAMIDAQGAIKRTEDQSSQLTLHKGDDAFPGFDIEVIDDVGSFFILVNARRTGSDYLSLDYASPSYAIWFDATSSDISFLYSPPTNVAIVWQNVYTNFAKLAVRSSTGSSYKISTRYETIEVIAGATKGKSVTTLWPNRCMPLGASWKVIQASGSGPTVMGIYDDRVVPNIYGQLLSVALNYKGVYPGNNCTDPLTVVQANSEMIVETDIAVVGASLKVRVVTFFAEFGNQS